MADYDVVVIGGGAGGLSAAREANRRGATVLLVSSGPLGGDCTWTGCVPSKTLIAHAAQGESFTEAIDAVRRTVMAIAADEDESALAREGIAVARVHARLAGGGRVELEGRTVRAEHVVIATGSAPVAPPIAGLDQVPHLTTEMIFDLDRLPPRLAVLGGGAVGCELSQSFARLGSAVTVIEAADRLLLPEEPEASEVIARRFEAEGILVRCQTTAEKVDLDDAGIVRIHCDHGDPVEADTLLVAVGRRPATAGLGLEEAGVTTGDDGRVLTDTNLSTSVDGVWAVGDVIGRMAFTHAADEMGRVAVHNALRGRRPARSFDTRAVPWVTFTSPEVARVGLSEAQAADHGGRVAYLPMAEVDRARTEGSTDGFVKLIAGPRKVLRNTGGGQVLGATIVAERGGELVNEVALAMRTRMFAGRLAQTVHAYPTWGLALRQAAAQLFSDVDGRTARKARRR